MWKTGQFTALVSPIWGISTLGNFPCILELIALEFAPRRHPTFALVSWLIVDGVKEIRMNPRYALLLALTLAAVALPLRAQTGCDDSPEDPTIVLALVGGAGALAASVRAARKRKS